MEQEIGGYVLHGDLCFPCIHEASPNALGNEGILELCAVLTEYQENALGIILEADETQAREDVWLDALADLTRKYAEEIERIFFEKPKVYIPEELDLGDAMNKHIEEIRVGDYVFRRVEEGSGQ